MQTGYLAVADWAVHAHHLENEVTVSSKTTPSKPIRKSLRQNMARNINVYKHVKKHMKEYSYMNALRALGSYTNRAHKDAFKTHLFLI